MLGFVIQRYLRCCWTCISNSLFSGSEETSLYLYMATIIVYIGVERNFKVGAVMLTMSFWTDFRMKCVISIIIRQLKKHSQ